MGMAGGDGIREQIGSSARIAGGAGRADAIREHGAGVLGEEARRQRPGLAGAAELAEREHAGGRALLAELAARVGGGLLVEERQRAASRVAVLEGAVRLAEAAGLGLEADPPAGEQARPARRRPGSGGLVLVGSVPRGRRAVRARDGGGCRRPRDLDGQAAPAARAARRAPPRGRRPRSAVRAGVGGPGAVARSGRGGGGCWGGGRARSPSLGAEVRVTATVAPSAPAVATAKIDGLATSRGAPTAEAVTTPLAAAAAPAAAALPLQPRPRRHAPPAGPGFGGLPSMGLRRWRSSRAARTRARSRCVGSSPARPASTTARGLGTQLAHRSLHVSRACSLETSCSNSRRAARRRA